MTNSTRPRAFTRANLEFVHAEEETNASRELLTDGEHLFLTVGSSQQQPGLRERRSHDDPSLRSTVVGCRRGILDELGSQGFDVTSAKNDDTRQRRIDNAISLFLDGKER